jgi:anti-anti-sigma factor
LEEGKYAELKHCRGKEMMSVQKCIAEWDLDTVVDESESSARDQNVLDVASTIPPGRPGLRVQLVDGFTLVDFVGAEIIYAEDSVRELGEQLYELVDEGNSRILLNFAGVQHISCAFLGKLVGLLYRARRANGRLVLYGLDPVLRDTFRICHLEGVFNI